jgi:radical SAM superfamily enzyme YgiQ (UPF0313 family)
MKDRKLLLIAMSGVRIKDPQLVEMGMTLPGFIERGNVIASLPSLSLLIVGACTPENWEIVYKEIDELNNEEISRIISSKYDLIAISTLTARILDTYKLADFLRSENLKVVIGGLHVSAMPSEAMQHADVVIQGEGELVWSKVIQDFEEDKLKPFYTSFEKGQSARPDDAIIPRYDLLNVNRYNRITVQASRGCPLHCLFCAASRTISSYKLKPIAHVEKELDAICAIWSSPFIELADDNTFVNKKWSKELIKTLSAYPIKWFTETDISVADDEELLELLAVSNCAQLLIGFESVSANSLNGLDTTNWKYRQLEHYVPKIQKIQSYGISVNGCFIFGFDADDENVFDDSKRFIQNSELSEVQVTILTPFPGTSLYKRLKEEARLIKDIYWDECTLFDVTFHPKKMSIADLQTGFRQLIKDLYCEDETRRRRKQFRQCVKLGRNKSSNHYSNQRDIGYE